MNDMARPNAAARLSEDIGDVLSSIRRLIAEDEAIGAARANVAPHLGDIAVATTAGTLSREDALARRFGGNAALAREMVSAHRRAEPVLRSPIRENRADTPAKAASSMTDPQDDDLTTMGADAPTWSFVSRLRPAEPAILRLEAADRIIPSSSGDHTPSGPTEAPAPWRAWTPAQDGDALGAKPDPAAPRPSMDARAPSADGKPMFVPGFDIDALSPRIAADPRDAAVPIVAQGEDEDDFAEQFDAIERQLSRPKADDIPATANDPANAAASAETTPSDHQQDTVSLAVARDTSAPKAAPAMDPYPSLALRLASAIRGRPLVAQQPAEARPSSARTAMSLPGAASAETEVADAAASAPVLPGPVFSAPAPVRSLPEPSVPTVEDIVEDPAMRALVREIIGEELHGELGTRFARNLRAVIRREVAAAIEDQMDRF